MLYTYAYTVLEADGRLTRDTEKIDAAAWLDYLKAHPERYGNLDEFVVASFPALKTENPLIAASLAQQIDDLFRDKEPTAVFQFLMYAWTAFKAGEIPARAWGAALALAWRCGERAMLDHVALSESLVLRMFEAAEGEALFQIGTGKSDWAAHIAALPERVEIYRGVTTALKYRENGLSWTTDPEFAKQCAGSNVQSLQDIPGVLHTTVAKSAILAAFEPGAELVIRPDAEKGPITANYLSGSALTKFRQNWKKWKAGEKAEKDRP